MAEPFKNLINAQTVAWAGQHLQRADAVFDRDLFERLAGGGLDALDMKARAMQIADALEATLPVDFGAAARQIEASLAPPGRLDSQGEDLGELRAGPAGLAGWVVWSLGEFVARRGRHDVPRALDCLHALTQRFSAEFSIRPLIAAAPEQVYPVLQRWTGDPSAHVRRLASEGSRPRLPWGLRLQALVADPAPSWPLLRALQDDPSAYVRRSVANHLNDIAKDHPEAVAHWVATHRVGASGEREALLRHASRSLIKQGHAPTLLAWGLGQGFEGEAQLALGARQLVLGESLLLTLTLRTTALQAQSLVIDYAVHHVKADGSTSPKVFKGWQRTLAPGETCVLRRQHPVKPISTRRYHPGMHRVVAQVNGQPVAEAAFELSLA
jgi:3-methyladenine DNA glycosylase AlkC